MKSDDVQRAVRASRHQRAAGDEPNLGKVARMPGTGIPKGERRRRKRGERKGDRRQQNNRFLVVLWSVFLGLLALGLVGGTVFFWLRQVMDTGEYARSKMVFDPESMAKVASRFESPSEDQALVLARSALLLRDPAKVPEAFHPATTSPQEIVRYLENLTKRNGHAAHFNWLGSMDENRLSIDGVLATFERGTKPDQRLFFLTPDAQGVWKIDFDSFARVTTPTWEELVENEAPQAVVRAHILRDHYYNGPFADDRQWVAYAFGSPDIEMNFYGYCKVGSPQAAAVESMFSKDQNVCRAILEIKRVEGASPRQFEITRVLAEGWVMGDAPFDEGY